MDEFQQRDLRLPIVSRTDQSLWGFATAAPASSGWFTAHSDYFPRGWMLDKLPCGFMSQVGYAARHSSASRYTCLPTIYDLGLGALVYTAQSGQVRTRPEHRPGAERGHRQQA